MKYRRALCNLGLVAALCTAGTQLYAQNDNSGPLGPPPDSPSGGPGGSAGGPGGGPGNGGSGRNFDPAQMQARMVEQVRDSLSVTNDDEWSALKPLVQKVIEARRDASDGNGPGMGGPGGPGGPGGMEGPSGSGGPGAMGGPGGSGGPDSTANSSSRSGGPGRMGHPASAERQALQAVLTSDASVDQVKEALAECRAARKDKQAKLEVAQTNLRNVLSVKQEAQAVLMGFLP